MTKWNDIRSDMTNGKSLIKSAVMGALTCVLRQEEVNELNNVPYTILSECLSEIDARCERIECADENIRAFVLFTNDGKFATATYNFEESKLTLKSNG